MKGESKQMELRWWFRNDRAMGTSETIVTIENIGYINYYSQELQGENG